MRSVARSIPLLFLVLISLLPAADAIGVTLTPLRMTIRDSIQPEYGQFFIKGIIIMNPNPYDVQVTLSTAENLYLINETTQFSMTPNQTKTIFFAIHTQDLGTSGSGISVQFKGIENGQEATWGLGSDISLDMNATGAPMASPKKTLSVVAEKGTAAGSIDVSNPYPFAINATIKSDLLQMTFDNAAFSLQPNETKRVQFTLPVKEDTTGNVYTTISTPYKDIPFTTRVTATANLDLLPWIIALAVLVIIGLLVLVIIKKKR